MLELLKHLSGVSENLVLRLDKAHRILSRFMKWMTEAVFPLWSSVSPPVPRGLFRSSEFPSTCSQAHIGQGYNQFNPPPCLLSQLLMTSYCIRSTVVSHCAHTLVTSVLFNPHAEAHKGILDLHLPQLAFISNFTMYVCFQTYCFIHLCRPLFILLSIFQQSIVIKSMHSEIRLPEFESWLCQFWDSGQVTSLLRVSFYTYVKWG